MPNLYIIAGCNGAGKTTASFTILPDILKVKEFVNADSIAAGLSPFNVEGVAFEAGGHNIPVEVIERRYYRGIANLLNLYIPVVDNWIVIDNMDTRPDIIARGSSRADKMILNSELWDILLNQSKSYGK